MKQTLLPIFLFIFPCCLLAQNDSIRLSCPLNEAVIAPPPKNAAGVAEGDLCIVVQSKVDTAVKAVINGKVTSVEQNPDEPGKWDIVYFTKFKNKDFYFWYTGVGTPIVRRNQVVKEGQPLGFIKPGEKIEMLMYDFETPVDPSKYINCK
jgi:hypothetical protein